MPERLHWFAGNPIRLAELLTWLDPFQYDLAAPTLSEETLHA